MTINKYQGKTKEEAIEKAKQELGANAVVLNIKEIKPKGMFRMFKDTTYEVTAAVEEREKFENSLSNTASPLKKPEGIHLTADEKIDISKLQETADRSGNTQGNTLYGAQKPEQGKVSPMKERKSENGNEGLEKRLENLSNILEKQLSVEGKRKDERLESQTANPEGFKFVKMLYRTLLENDVNEKYVNQIMDEAEKILHSGSSVDSILSNVYQKMILKFGQPDSINLAGKKPKIIFFIGPTGVGKTTTIAKIASRYKVEEGMKVAFLTADTYRIAATEQLRVYAPMQLPAALCWRRFFTALPAVLTRLATASRTSPLESGTKMQQPGRTAAASCPATAMGVLAGMTPLPVSRSSPSSGGTRAVPMPETAQTSQMKQTFRRMRRRQ